MIIFFIILFIFTFILNSKIKIEIYFASSNSKNVYNISIIYFKKLKTFYKDDIKKLLLQQKLKGRNIKKEDFQGLNIILKYANFEKLIIAINLGLVTLIPTILAVPILATCFSYLFAFLNLNVSKNHVFTVLPIYNKLHFSSKFHCIVSFKIAHIIYIIIKLFFERRKKNE